MINIQLRYICTSVRLQTTTPGQLGKIVHKVMNMDKTKKLRKKESLSGKHVTQATPVISYGVDGIKNSSNYKNRRVTALNKIFMEYISDLMTTGEIAPKLVGRGIEITHVKVTSDFRLINVYWIAENKTDTNEDIEQILRQAAGKLQHELSGLRVIGVVPPIQFVKNKHYASIKDVENLLSKVDYGEDYVPTGYIVRKEIPVLEAPLPSELKTTISTLENESHTEGVEYKTDYEIIVPEMRQDILGVNYAGIMKRITHALKTTKLAQNNRILNISEDSEPQMSTEDLTNMLSNREQNKIFDDFLKNRLVEEKRKLKGLPLKEIKLLEEEEWIEKMENDSYDEDLKIEDEYKNEYEEIEEYRK